VNARPELLLQVVMRFSCEAQAFTDGVVGRKSNQFLKSDSDAVMGWPHGAVQLHEVGD
jgi:hypothetical protein